MKSKQYFVNDGDVQECTYIHRNPFTSKPDNLSVETGEHQEHIALHCYEGVHKKLKDYTLANICLNANTLYPGPAKNAIPFLNFLYFKDVRMRRNVCFLLFLQSSRKQT